ncbi:alpha/beta hydrolase [Pseudoruegeria sp. SK021]|uniref:alpha/beta hydrolase n=1 Tax=Pseudoruegeria sp. SK021 TaxID=1933035 RepID=UPI000A260E61|nr:alpha/beta hydrolase [Pseudoruegeria sp. SK021]OSP55169.1 hypothetical protein BV911_09075 [Pseudoruegeria sp. SK021]
MPDYVFTVRNKRGEVFGSDAGMTRFLRVPETDLTTAPHHQIRKGAWFQDVLAEGTRRIDPDTGQRVGDIVIYVHGFNNSTEKLLSRHRKIKASFARQGFQGVVVSFDWPAADTSLNYLEDRWDAKQTANQLVKEGIASFVKLQTPDCEVNLHLMAHSMGCYVVREAFDDADDRRSIAAVSWSVSQILLFGADVSVGSLAAESAKSSSLYRHCNRLTNYFNPFDAALSLSNVKRIGVSPRAGRVGLPAHVPAKAVNVDCGAHYTAPRHKFEDSHFAGHRWYFDDDVFLQDAYLTILGSTDRNRLPTRLGRDSNLSLVAPVVGTGQG